MGDWEDLCESLGLTAAAQWEEVEERLFRHERPRCVRSMRTVASLSETDRPRNLPTRVAEAFQAAGHDPPREAEMFQYSYRFRLPTGGGFDLWYNRFGHPTAFAPPGGSKDECLAVRQALQLYLPRPCPSDMSVWSRNRERKMREAFAESGFHGLWIDHKPLKTLVVLRRSRYRFGAADPGIAKSKRVGLVVLEHHDAVETKVLSRHGNAELQSRLVDGLVVFGLLGVQEVHPAIDPSTTA